MLILERENCKYFVRSVLVNKKASDKVVRVYPCNDTGYEEPGICTGLQGESGQHYLVNVCSYDKVEELDNLIGRECYRC